MPFDDLAPETKDLLRQKAVDVKAISLQRGSDRFKKDYEQRRHGQIPVIREWRLNLARLSHNCNLFLVAYLDKIYVYEPSHPKQELSEKPALILSPPKTPSARHGYLDEECPHSINHLIVDFLGNLEIILVACDDGDIIGYYINDIQTGIERRLNSAGPSTIIGDEVQPFFMYSVRLSAWGLSVHSEARRIAISSNTHEVTVISFGLTDDEYEDSVRSNDHKFVMTGFHNNLPSVTFCNTKDDPQGRLLISGEITGLVYMHDLETLNRTEIMQIGFCRRLNSSGMPCDCLDRASYPHSIWGLSFIDNRAFRKMTGYAPDQLSNMQFEKHWNGSIMKHCVPNTNGSFRLKRARGGYQTHVFASGSSSENDDDEEDDDDDNDDDDDDDNDENMDDGEEFFAEVLLTHSPGHLHSSLRNMTHPWLANEQPPLSPRMLSRSSYITSKKFHFSRWASPFQDETSDVALGKIPCPLLITSKTDISLLQPEDEHHLVNPIITLDDPLNQVYECGDSAGARPSFTHSSVNRMSLHYVIPELGVLVVGSPNGRVAVFSLLRTDEWLSRPDGTHFMRLDWILPFAAQEEEGLRPERKLLGLAAGPMQGQLGRSRPEIRRRWRLILYYGDHSVLTYELSLPD